MHRERALGTGRGLSRSAAAAGAAALLGVSVVLFPAGAATLIAAAFVVPVVVAVTKALTPTGERRRILTWTVGALVLHAAIGLVILSSGQLTGYFGGDATTYSNGAAAITHHWTGGGPIPAGTLPAGKAGFYYLLGFVYLLVGVHGQAGVIVDAGMTALVIPVLADATRRHFGPEASRAVPAVLTLLPGFLIWGSQLLREAGVYLFLAVAVDAAVRLMERSRPAALAALALSLGLATTFRADVGLLAAAGLAVALMVGRRQVAGGVASGIGVVALLLALVLGAGLGYSGYRLVTHTNLAQVNDIRSDSSHSAASGYLADANVSSARHAASYIPLGSAYLLLGPAPWQLRGGRQLFALPDVASWWFLLPSLRRGIKEAKRRRGREVLLYILPSLALTAVLTLLIANFGTATRERLQVVVLLVPLISLGWSLRHRRNQPVGSDGPIRRLAVRPNGR